MAKLIRMDLYRMLKSRSFLVCLVVAFLISLSSSPLARLLLNLAITLSGETKETIEAEVKLSAIFQNPFPLISATVALISLCYFFYADVENGYIKNIAGQMPMKGFTILSKFAAAAVHNLIFAVVCIIGDITGTILVMRVVPDDAVLEGLRVLALKLLLYQSIAAILLLVVTTFRSKALGMILAVLFGMEFAPLIYMGINEGLRQVFGPDTDISRYMPDTVMNENPLDTVKAILVAVVSGAVFLLPAIRIFDRKDVK